MLEQLNHNHSVSQLAVHIVWCTKYRHKVLINLAEEIVKQTIAEACIAYNYKLIALEVMPDHVHCLVQLPPTEAPTNVAKTLKSLTAIAVFNKCKLLKQNKFWGSGLWSNSTYYGSVGETTAEIVKNYVNTQKLRE